MVRTPIISDIINSSTAILLTIHVRVGDVIAMDQRVAEIDTDKATIGDTRPQYRLLQPNSLYLEPSLNRTVKHC